VGYVAMRNQSAPIPTQVLRVAKRCGIIQRPREGSP
jgi:hypothetical protein